MKRAFTIFIVLCISGLSWAQSAQNFWTDVSSDNMFLPRNAEVELPATNHRALSLDFGAMLSTLRQAPMEFTEAGRNSPVIMALPMPDGTFENFRIQEAPVMAPGLAARYPQIRSFKGFGVDSKRSYVRLDYGPDGFHAYLRTPKGEVYIDPYASNQTAYYICYFSKDVDFPESETLSCGYTPAHAEASPIEGLEFENNEDINFRDDALLSFRTYRLALACTGEYASGHGGTLTSVMSSFNTAVNRLNAIFEQEVAVRMELIETNDELIFLDGATDPFDDPADGGGLLGQNQSFLNMNVGNANYDVGHIFTGQCSDGLGGIAIPSSACVDGQKGLGVTCHSSSNVTSIVNRIMSHEIGHQFSARHTWNFCPNTVEDSPDQYHSESAMEPGSGSTIMSYAGTCGGGADVQNNGDLYYNIRSLESFIGFSTEGDGATCGTLTTTENNIPELELPYEDGFLIPISTPFELNASATDIDNDELTYCWEQHDTGPYGAPGSATLGTPPLFRSFPPREASNRVFPRLGLIVSNSSSNFEVLPTYSRELSFSCTVRDNHDGFSSSVWEIVEFRATESAGPFLVMGPNEGMEQWEAGDYVEVTWDVANTDNAVVNCQMVNIKLSVDGGFNYPITLATNTPNDGSAFISVPDAITTDARVKVEAADNIFFDISNQDFEIVPATEPGFAVSVSPASQVICLPGEASFDLNTISLLEYDSTITLDIVEGLPENAIANFSTTAVTPSESTSLNIDLSAVSASGTYDVVVRAVGPNADTTLRTLQIRTVSTDYSDLVLTGPVDGENGIGLSTTFSWSNSNAAQRYDFQLATSPTFELESILEFANNLTDTSYTPSILLEENALFYWRIIPSNECGVGDPLLPASFHTQSVNCAPNDASDTPINISGTGTPTVQSTLFVESDGIISDVNIPLLRANYQPVNSLRATLISPAGTEVVLFDQNCGTTLNLLLGFDDDAPNEIQCPPDDAIVFKPIEPLSAFIGENTAGNWTMRLEVVESGFGASGAFQDWSLEFCASETPVSPLLITNEALELPPGMSKAITPAELEVTDEDNTPFEIEYTLVTVPENGTLYFQGTPLGIGDMFRQASINANNVWFTHDGSDTQTDSFYFIVEDGTGGLIPNQQFNIIIDEGAVVNTEDLDADRDVSVFPNPTTGQINVAFNKVMDESITLSLLNVQGQEVLRQRYEQVGQLITMNASNLPSGVYFVTMQTDKTILTKKVMVQK